MGKKQREIKIKSEMNLMHCGELHTLAQCKSFIQEIILIIYNNQRF